MTIDMPETPAPPRPRKGRRLIVLAAVAIGAVIGYAAVASFTGSRNVAGDPLCKPAVALSKKIAPLATGEVAGLTMATAPLRIPDLTFKDGDGADKKLSDWR